MPIAKKHIRPPIASYKRAKEITRIQFLSSTKLTYAEATKISRKNQEVENKQDMSKEKSMERKEDETAPGMNRIKHSDGKEDTVTERNTADGHQTGKNEVTVRRTSAPDESEETKKLTSDQTTKNDSINGNNNQSQSIESEIKSVDCVEKRKLMNFIKAMATVLKSENTKNEMIETLTGMMEKLIEEIEIVNGKKSGETKSKSNKIIH